MTAGKDPKAQQGWLLCVALATLGLMSCGGGGGGAELSPEEQEAVTVAGSLSAGLEYALAGGGILTEADLTAGVDEPALTSAAASINDLLDGCLTAEVLTDPVLGLNLAFPPDGCDIPLTSLFLKGSMTALFAKQADGTTSIAATFNQFKMFSVDIDGSLTLTSGQGAFEYDAQDLHVVFSDYDVTVSGAGTFSRASDHSTVTFTGTGNVTWGGKTYGFDAANISREFVQDCYPEEGRITISYTSESGTQVSATISYDDSTLDGLDSDDTGVVYLDFSGKHLEAKLPARDCSGI
jgi:hypothetical protein